MTLGAAAPWRHRIARDPALQMLFWGTAAVLLLFVLYPSLTVISYPSLRDYLAMPGHPRWLAAFRNSMMMMVLSTLSTTGLGLLYAYATSRWDLPGRRFFKQVALLPLFAPPFMVAFAYILLFGRQGIITKTLLGWDVNIFGWKGLWLVQTVAFFPYAVQIIGQVLENANPTLEYAARNMGADEFTVLRTVTIPMARPGVAGAMLLVAISVLADFGNAVVIAGDFPLLATDAWYRIEGLADLTGAAVVVSALVIPTLLLFLLERRWVQGRLFVTVGGRGSRLEPPPTPGYIKAVLVAFCSVVAVFILSVYVAIVAGAFTKTWGYDWSFTLQHWRLGLQQAGDHLMRSIHVGAVSALITSVVAVVAAYVASRRRLPFTQGLDFMATLPAALPGVFMGVGYLLAFSRPPFLLQGTPWILILALAFWHVPFGYRAARATLHQVDDALEDAANDLGASGLQVLWDIYRPLLAEAFIASFGTAFTRAVTNVSIMVFVVTPRNLVATYSILSMIGGGFWGAAAALTTILLVITFVVLAITRLIGWRGLAGWKAR